MKFVILVHDREWNFLENAFVLQGVELYHVQLQFRVVRYRKRVSEELLPTERNQ